MGVGWMERAGAPAGSQIRLEPIQEPAGVPATPRSRIARRASLRVGRKSIAGGAPNHPTNPRLLARALAIDCRPIQPLQTPRSFCKALSGPLAGLSPARSPDVVALLVLDGCVRADHGRAGKGIRPC